MKKILSISGIVVFISLGLYLGSIINKKPPTTTSKISIVTTLFPHYDFAKVIGGNKVDVTLLLPPGVEAHAYEPKPSDILKIRNAHVFVYTSESMEPWAHDIIKGVDSKVRIVDASVGVNMMKDDDHESEDGGEHQDEDTNHHESEDGQHNHSGVDPHIWLDFENANIMAKNTTQALTEVDPQNAEYYRDNLKSYQDVLAKLDSQYKKTLSACQSKTIIFGGHYAFGYMAKRYGLEYVSAQGFSPDAEPTAKDMIAMVQQVKDENIGYIFYEELTSPKIAQTLANETDTILLLLNGAHNISKTDFEDNVSFVSIMEDNLKNLQIGLRCSQ